MALPPLFLMQFLKGKTVYDLSYLNKAENLIKTVEKKQNLRTLDAFQLAAFQSEATSDWQFLTADISFANTAISLKINVLNV